jgi:hypothetical protein
MVGSRCICYRGIVWQELSLPYGAGTSGPVRYQCRLAGHTLTVGLRAITAKKVWVARMDGREVCSGDFCCWSNAADALLGRIKSPLIQPLTRTESPEELLVH